MEEAYLSKKRAMILKEIGLKMLLVVGVLTSVWYALRVEKTDIQTFEALYTWFTQGYININIMGFSYVMTKYLKKLGIIWLLGWFAPTIPLSCLLLLGVIFSYGFTTTALILLLGAKGMMLGFVSYGIQGILLLSISFEILKKSIDLGIKEKIGARKKYVQLLFPLIGGSLIMALLDLGVVNVLKLFPK